MNATPETTPPTTKKKPTGAKGKTLPTKRARADKIGLAKKAERAMRRREASYTIAARQAKVYELRMAKLDINDIAQRVGCDRKTVMQDLERIDQQLKETIDSSRAAELLNERLKDLRMVREAAARAMAEGAQKGPYLKIILEANRDETKLMQDAGLLATAPVKVETVNEEGDVLTVNLNQTMPVSQEHVESWLRKFIAKRDKAQS